MDEESFNPKQWVTGSTSNQAATTTQSAPGDFWRAALEHPSQDTPPSRPVQTGAPVPDRGRLNLGLGLAFGLLATAALAAWAMRSDPVQTSVSTAAAVGTASGTDAGIQERAVNLAGPDQLATALAEVGIATADATAATAAAAPHLAGSSGEIHAIFVIAPGESGRILQQLRAMRIDGSGVILARNADGTYAVTPLFADLSRKVQVLRGEIDSESFYTSAVTAGLVDTLIPEFINAFAYDFNLASEVSPGDVFEVAYDQQVNAQGEPVGQAKLLFAQLTTPRKSLALYRFEQAGGEVGWFDGNGATTKRGLMRTPVDGARITSKFGMRFHPVLHYNKLHRGTDFAAPTGTPIYAAADGTIEFAAMKGANGNLTILRHDNGWETYYLHQSMFAPGISAGARVTQGQHIGDIGTTGRSTGPHLHYEVHIDGQPVDPLSVPADDSSRKRLDGAALQAFLKERDRIDTARSQRTL